VSDDGRDAAPAQPLGRRQLLGLAAGAGAVVAAPRRAFARRPRPGGSLKHIGVEPVTFDVQTTASPTTPLVSSLVRRTLFKVVSGIGYQASDVRLVPDLALKAEASRDGRAYTIALRRGVHWEDKPPVNGREVVAADVKYSMERALRRSPFASLLGPVDGVEAVGPHTVRVHLREAFTPFVQNLAEPWTAVLPPEVEERLGDFKSAHSLIGCGPFVLDRYEPGIKAVFARNPAYYQGGRPYLDRVEWIFVKDGPTRLSLFSAGEIDIPSEDGRIPRSEVAALRRSRPEYPIARWDGLSTRALAMRVDLQPFRDVRVRRALSLALDRRKWVSRDLEGQGFEDSGPIPAPMRRWKLGLRELGEGAKYLAYDPGLARKLLAEAGFPRGLRVKCTHWRGFGDEYVEDVTRLATELREVGVELSLVDEGHDGYLRGSFLGRYEEATWSVSPPWSEVDSYLGGPYRSGLPTNQSHVADPRLDALLDLEQSLRSGAARRTAIAEIQQRAAAQVYYVYTPSPKNVAAWTPRVRNYAPKNSLDRGAQLEVVWLDDDAR
jgi:peptide/nickel transport system substrate-binding protein